MENQENWFESSPKRKFRFGLSKQIQTPLIWTLFFTIVGLVIKGFESKSFSFPQTIIDFFTVNYISWFASFGNLTTPNFYASEQDLIFALLNNWYYFFITGGILALLWGILSWIIHLEINVETPPKEEKISQDKLRQAQMRARINNLVAEGMKALTENNQKQAESIYLQAKQEYKKELDPLRESYNSLVNLYQEILKNRKV
jgi:hypothetical protein